MLITPFAERKGARGMLRHSREGENPERGLMSFRAEGGGRFLAAIGMTWLG